MDAEPSELPILFANSSGASEALSIGCPVTPIRPAYG
jgi:hypothetical protein